MTNRDVLTHEVWSLVERFAPTFYQRLWWSRQAPSDPGKYDRRDFITRVDLAGWPNVPLNHKLVGTLLATDFTPTIYWWAAATEQTIFIGYAVYHPYDWCSDWWRFMKFAQRADEHPNDMEGVLVVVERLASGPKLRAILTVAHYDILPFIIDSRNANLRPSKLVHRPERTLLIPHQWETPRVYIEAGSHAISCWGAQEAERTWPLSAKGIAYHGKSIFPCATFPIERSHQFQRVRYFLESINGFANSLKEQENGSSLVFGLNLDSGTLAFMRYNEETATIQPGKALPPWQWSSSDSPAPRGSIYSDPLTFVRGQLIRRKQPWPDSLPYLWNTTDDAMWA